MQTALDIALIVVMLLCLILHFFSLPGNLIILAVTLVYGLITDFAELGLKYYIFLGLLVVLGEACDFISGVIGAGRFGATKYGIIGSVVGGIVGGIAGAPILFGLGAIPGVFIGAFLGAVVVEFSRGRELQDAFRAGFGAFLGRAFGIFFKIMIGLGMVLLIVRAIFF